MSYAYHQRFDGQTEVMNRVIEEILRVYINYNQDNWYHLLPYVTSSINNSINPRSNLSPNQIYYGRSILRPVNLLTRSLDAIPSVKDYFQKVVDLSKLGQDYARTALIDFSSRHFKNLHRVVDPRLVVGSKVMIDASNLIIPSHHERPSKKLMAKRVGPRTIIKKLSDVSFRVDMPRPGCLAPEPDYVDTDHEYIVSRLDARRTHYRKLQYFVVYKGYPVDDGQWRPLSELKDTCPGLIKAYDLKHPIE